MRQMFNANIVAGFAQQQTPFYYYDLGLLKNTLTACNTAAAKYNFHVHFALKANCNKTILALIKDNGLGADCVSGGELIRANETGFDAQKTVFAGVGKSDSEINIALDLDIFCFNVESVQELFVINELAQAKNKTAGIAIRVNPNVDAHTHQYITTGLDENKFGINMWELPAVAEALKACKNLKFLGIHFHIGSQITNMNVFKSLCVKVNEVQNWFEERGMPVKVLNVGGGLGINYHQPDEDAMVDFEAYFKIFNDFLDVKPGKEVHFELGRALVAQCSSLISKVLYVKNGKNKNFVILDAGMSELIRPALYQAYHQIENISQLDKNMNTKYDVVGPVCESSDCFGKEVMLPETQRGNLVAIRSTGAYGEVMISVYNLRPAIGFVFSE